VLTLPNNDQTSVYLSTSTHGLTHQTIAAVANEEEEEALDDDYYDEDECKPILVHVQDFFSI